MAITPKQNFMEGLLVKLARKLNQELTRMEKISGENPDFAHIVDSLIKENIALMHEKISESFPKSAILFENTTDFIPQEHDGTKFLITPLGGIRNLIHCNEDVFISIAFENENEKLEDAVVFNPFTDQKYYASNNDGAFSTNLRLRASNRKESCDYIIYTNTQLADKKDFDKTTQLAINELKNGNLPRITGAVALDLLQVLSGKKDALVACGITPQELAIAKLFAQESGAVITDFNAKPLTKKTSSIVVTNSKLHATIIKQLNK